jgi:hypothetical protein
MDEPNFILETLCAVRPDGTPAAITVRLGKPTKDARDDDPKSNTYQCVIHCEGLDAAPRVVYGEGPMQALHLGLKMIRVQLESAEAGGLRFIWPDTGEPQDWQQLWYSDSAPDAG